MALVYIRKPGESKEDFEARKAAGEQKEQERRDERERKRQQKAAEREAAKDARREDREDRIRLRQKAANDRREDREDRIRERQQGKTDRTQVRQQGRTDRAAERNEAAQIREQGKVDSGYWTPEADAKRQETAQKALETVGDVAPYAALGIAAAVGGDKVDGLVEKLTGEGSAIDKLAGRTAETGAQAAVSDALKKATPWLVAGVLLVAGIYALSQGKR